MVSTRTILRSEKTKTQKESRTSKEVKKVAVDPLDRDISSRPTSAASISGECGLTSTRSGASITKKGKGIDRRLVMNCSELSVNSARRITTRYLGIRPDDYSMTKIIQPNGERRFDISLGAEVPAVSSQKWQRVAKALRAKIKEHVHLRQRSNVKPREKICVGMEEEFSVMTYNINGLWSKRHEAFFLLDKRSPTVCSIQETLKTSHARTLIPRYQVIENVAKPGGGARGLLLAVRRNSGFTLSEYEVEDWFVSGQVDATLQDGSCIRMLVYSVYIPCTGVGGRPEAKERLRWSLEKAWRKGNFSQIILSGDFNMQPAEFDRYLESTHIGIRRVVLSEATRIGKIGNISTLDYHAAIGMAHEPLQVEVLKEIDLSDHLPVLAKWKLPSTPKVQLKLSFKTMELIEKKGFFLSNERWITTAGSKTVDELAKAFADTAWEIAKQHGVVREYQEPKWSNWMSKETLALIKARQEMAALRGTALFNQQIYDQLWSDTIAARKADAKHVSQKKVRDMCEAGRENRFKDLWNQLESACGGKYSAESERPILDKSTGEYRSTASEKGKVWANHFEALAKDETGNSRTDNYWKLIMPAVETVPVRDLCDDPLTWAEARMALQATPNGKAAGIDKIPGELLKLTQEEETPTSALGKALWTLLEKIWVDAKVPALYNTAIVVPVPKKGDLSDPDNYRGISLISVAMKIISKVVATRLQTIAERDDLLVKEQAGFRTREECVAQVATLCEIVQRRSNAVKNTYAIFIDFAKAYDKVPHRGMLRKLESIGIKGHLFKVIEALYEDPAMCVRMGNDFSEVVKYSCGVRQGCPASPILFDLYINDIFIGIEGVHVPGIATAIPGLLFADDAVVFAESEEMLAKYADMLNGWAIKWEMKVNVRKCGVLTFPTRVRQVEGPETKPLEIYIGGEIVPRVDRYTYLGVTVDRELSRETMVGNNINKGRKALGGLIKFFSRRTYPTYLKVLLVKAKLIPILAYGGEVWGMNSQIAEKAQKVCDAALRIVIRGSKSTGLRRVREELGIDTMASISARKRQRAITKFSGVRTWIASLIGSKAKSRFDTWVTGGLRWMRTYIRADQGEEQLQDSKRRLLELFSERDRRKDRTRASARAAELGLTQSSPWLEMEGLHPELCEMLTEVGRMRIGIFPTGKRLVFQHVLDFDYSNRCPICNNSTPETLEHLFLECPTWKVAREMLIPCFPRWEDMLKSPAAMTLAVGVLLGGERGKGGNTFVEANGPQDQEPVITTLSVATREPTEMVLVAARFLADIIPIRRRVLGQKLRNPSRTSSWNQGQRGTVAPVEP